MLVPVFFILPVVFVTVALAQLGLALLLKEACFALGPSSICVWMVLLNLLDKNAHVEQRWLRHV